MLLLLVRQIIQCCSFSDYNTKLMNVLSMLKSIGIMKSSANISYALYDFKINVRSPTALSLIPIPSC
jgi:hypothetical protein